MNDESRAQSSAGPRRIPEERAAKLLERAAALDAKRSSEFEIDQLREAAAAAGISREAFEEALSEQSGNGSGDDEGREHGRRSAAVRYPERSEPVLAMSEVTYYSGLLRDLLGDEGQVSVTDVIQWKDPAGVTAAVSPTPGGVTATVTAEGRLRRKLLGMLWAVLPLLLITFVAAFEADEFIIMFFGGLIALVAAMIGATISDRRERKELRRKVERIRRQLQRALGPGPTER